MAKNSAPPMRATGENPRTRRIRDIVLPAVIDLLLAEGAGAVATAGALKNQEALKGKKVVIVVSGGNITLTQLEESIKVYQKGR